MKKFLKNQKKNINISLINKRFIELIKPANSYCRKNYIKFKGIIDKIIKLSHPYDKNEKSNNLNKHNNKQNIKENINDEIDNFTKEIDFEKIRNI